MRAKREQGQAILLVLVALSILMIGAMGLAIDGSQLFAHSQMAQVAADAAAQAGMMTIFQGVNNVTANPTTYFPTTTFTCTPGTDPRTPCQYARMNGFGIDANDTVTVSFPGCAGCPYGGLLAGVTPNQVQVTVTRNVGSGLIRMLGAGPFTTVNATGIAATVEVVSPVPILILHPTLPGALSGTGVSRIDISGGPSRSIQVNSNARPDAYGGGSHFVGTIDLHLAGPFGTGADFAVFGGPANQPGGTTWILGTGKYDHPSSPMSDPLLGILPPGAAAGDPVDPPAPPTTPITPSSSPNYGCADFSPAGCTLYQPGRYAAGISQAQGTAIFQPGVYIMENGNGFEIRSTGAAQICTTGTNPIAGWPAAGAGCLDSPVTQEGMLVYNEGGGLFKVTGGGAARLRGTRETDVSGNLTRYAGILFFQDRASPPATGPGINAKHSIGGNGCIDLVGTIYITNTAATMWATPGHYQMVEYNGNPCSGTFLRGMIITDVLKVIGTADLKMFLNPQGYLKIRQVALVGGGPHL